MRYLIIMAASCFFGMMTQAFAGGADFDLPLIEPETSPGPIVLAENDGQVQMETTPSAAAKAPETEEAPSTIENPPSPSLQKPKSASGRMSLSSHAASRQANMPVAYTCDGKNISPELSWNNAPTPTQSFALIVSDPDAPGGLFYHWVLYNLPKDTQELTEGISPLPNGTITASNTFGKNEYDGPCPPKGSAHHYIFSLYALDTTFSLGTDIGGADLEKSMHGHVLQKASYQMTYSRL